MALSFELDVHECASPLAAGLTGPSCLRPDSTRPAHTLSMTPQRYLKLSIPMFKYYPHTTATRC